jgi:hypothetical protein
VLPHDCLTPDPGDALRRTCGVAGAIHRCQRKGSPGLELSAPRRRSRGATRGGDHLRAVILRERTALVAAAESDYGLAVVEQILTAVLVSREIPPQHVKKRSIRTRRPAS